VRAPDLALLASPRELTCWCRLYVPSRAGYNYWSKQVRTAVALAGYDRESPPDGRSSTGLAGTVVGLQLRVFKMIEVSVAKGTLKMMVWLRMQWKDERLAWDPAAYGGITSVTYNAQTPETQEVGGLPRGAHGDAVPSGYLVSQIWVPDITLLNSQEYKDVFNPTNALVRPACRHAMPKRNTPCASLTQHFLQLLTLVAADGAPALPAGA